MLDHFHVPIEDQVRVNRDDLHRTTADIFTVMGLSQEDANLAADGLVTADIRGCETHGVSNMLRVYKKLYEDGNINPQPRWKITRESSAWETFIWFGGILSISSAVSDSQVIQKLVPELGAYLENWNYILVLVLITALYMYLHYLFASMTAQIVTLYTAFVILAVSAGVPPLLSALALAFFSNLYACLTHYGDGAGPILFGSGYIELRDWWKIGFLLSL